MPEGESVDVYAGEKKDTDSFDYIINVMNYALDFGFNKMNFVDIDTEVFYKRGYFSRI